MSAIDGKKGFFEVFPTLKLPEDLRELFSGASVKMVLKSRDGKDYHIYTVFHSIVDKRDIYKVERELRKQVFCHTDIIPKLHESFALKDGFSPEAVMEVYSDSVSVELMTDYPILNQIYKNSEIEYDGDKVTLKVPEEMIFGKEAERLAEDLSRYLSNVFNKRMGVGAELKLEYESAGISIEREKKEAEIKREFKELMALRSAKSNEGEKARTEDASEQEGNGAEKADPKGKGKKKKKKEKEKSPDVIYKYDFEGEAIPIKLITGPMGDVILRGQLLSYEEFQAKSGIYIITLGLTDFTDSIKLKLFIKEEELPAFKEVIRAEDLEKKKEGMFVKVKGIADFDKFEHDTVITGIRGIKKISSFKELRVDLSAEKRTELHVHTKFSEMDGVSSIEDILKTADAWGWKSLAVTDHGNVQAFPVAYKAKKKLSNPDFKVIYGLEGYLVDDTNDIFWRVGKGDGKEIHAFNEDFVVFDIETTGFSPITDRIIEIGAVRIVNGEVTDTFDEFVNPGIPIPWKIKELTGIDDFMVKDADPIDEVLKRFLDFSRDAVIVAHNAAFDTSFIEKNAEKLGLEFDKAVVDTLGIARFLLPDLKNHKLDTLSEHLEVSLENHHRAVDDATATGEIFLKLMDRIKAEHAEELKILEDFRKFETIPASLIKKRPYYHIIILAKNETGRVNLYKLVSKSHLEYFQRRPRIPRSVLSSLREGLILGSACEAGELYRALEKKELPERIAKIVAFYDYLEIQPIGNNEFLLREEDGFETEEDLRDMNRKIFDLGRKFNKPVCATCDVHFLNPEDEVYRRILMFSKGFKDADMQAPLFLRTTREMLDEFSYLGDDNAYEVVIKNPNTIADMIDDISPVRPDKSPPIIEDSDKTLRDICYKKAVEMYGENLPEEVTSRLETELKSIIGNGYAVMYVIAQKLVWKSNEDGYLVGSRGSVGSSFAAFMAGITEVNSLPPHYLCPKCHYSDFTSETVKKAHEEGLCGCDLEPAKCPECGTEMLRQGYDIPFETFLGFSGDKEPDIDLNFSGDYQSKAHKYTEVIFGEGQTFRAGTIGTVADKTAFGFTLKYFEDEAHDEYKRRAEMERLARGCEGVLRTTGQHPGGIVVLPRGEDINTYTPVQHPANDVKTPIITTHFEYHSIDHNLLKLDILGHDDPTMIRFLEDATGVDSKEIPFDDKKVMSLFNSPEAMGITPDDIGGCATGSLGIPEFGTDFVIQMLIDTEPSCFSDLVRISGLSHGTDVWSGNAQVLVNEKGMKLSECICCRDDIMLYLINKHLDPALSFKIMESVRKGKGLTEDMKAAMQEQSIPDWYQDSCLKIKYMFPKAHAVAYVMMGFRVAWYKLYKPLAYYSAFFSIRSVKSGGIDYETMCQGKEKLEETLKEPLEKLKLLGKKKMTATEQDSIKNMQLVQEMYARGFDFEPIDIFRADARYFRQTDEKHIMPPLCSIAGMGMKDSADIVAGIEATRDQGDFLSLEDFLNRTGCSRSKAEKLKKLGILGKIPDSGQISLFDFMDDQ